jgi:hypothetical protein
MKHSTSLNLILNSEKLSLEEISKQIIRARDAVSEGRYLVTVFDAPKDWTSRIPIEGLVISSTLGNIEDRSHSWEFYGNGAIRCYRSKSLKLSRTLQWNIVRRTGDKPYVRRPGLPTTFLKKNMIPVSDKAFTRDVANNVWHLKEEDLQDRIIARFSSLLTWQDEEFTVFSGTRSRKIAERTRLDLSGDLVGVPTKIPYFWDSEDVLF